MAKFHVNEKGEARKCGAQKGNCPFGGDNEHYDSEQEAQVAAEKQLEQEFGAIAVSTKTVPKVKEIEKLSVEEQDAIEERKNIIRHHMAAGHGYAPFAADNLTEGIQSFWANFRAVEGVERDDVVDIRFDADSLTTGTYTLKDGREQRFDISNSKRRVDDTEDKVNLYADVEQGFITHELFADGVRRKLVYSNADPAENYAWSFTRVMAPHDTNDAPYDYNATEEQRLVEAGREINEVKRDFFDDDNEFEITSVDFQSGYINFMNEDGARVSITPDEAPYLAHFLTDRIDADKDVIRYWNYETDEWNTIDRDAMPVEWRAAMNVPLERSEGVGSFIRSTEDMERWDTKSAADRNQLLNVYVNRDEDEEDMSLADMELRVEVSRTRSKRWSDARYF